MTDEWISQRPEIFACAYSKPSSWAAGGGTRGPRWYFTPVVSRLVIQGKASLDHVLTIFQVPGDTNVDMPERGIVIFRAHIITIVRETYKSAVAIRPQMSSC